MADVNFEDYSMQVISKITQKAIAALYEGGGELASQVKRGSLVNTGQLKNSWDYDIDEAELKATVGSPLENAIWNEFGTGQYALSGNGRKTPWKYKDHKGTWHTTTGKKPQRTFNNAFVKFKPKFQKIVQLKFKELNGK